MKKLSTHLAFAAFLCLPSAVLAEDCDKAAVQRNETLRADIANEERVTRLKAIVALCPKLAEAQFDLGQAYLKTGEDQAAQTSFEEAARLTGEARYRIALANLFASRGELDRADAIFQDLLQKFPQDTRAHQGLSFVSAAHGDLASAEKYLREGIQIEPSSSQLFFNLGLILERQGRLDEAALSFQAAVEKQGAFIEALAKLGDLQGRLGRSTAAEQSLQRAILLDPKRAEIWRSLGSIYFRMKSYRDAEKALLKAEALEPQNAAVKRELGVVLVSAGKIDRGEALLHRAAEIATDETEKARAFGAIGWTLIQKEDLVGARAELEKAEALNREDASLQNNLGVVFDLLGDSEKARQHFEKARALDPKLESAEAGLRSLEN